MWSNVLQGYWDSKPREFPCLLHSERNTHTHTHTHTHTRKPRMICMGEARSSEEWRLRLQRAYAQRKLSVHRYYKHRFWILDRFRWLILVLWGAQTSASNGVLWVWMSPYIHSWVSSAPFEEAIANTWLALCGTFNFNQNSMRPRLCRCLRPSERSSKEKENKYIYWYTLIYEHIRLYTTIHWNKGTISKYQSWVLSLLAPGHRRILKIKVKSE